MFFQAEDGIRDLVRSRGLGDVYKRQHGGRGDFHMDPSGLLSRRKPGRIAPFVYTGVQLISPRLLADAPAGPFSTNILWDRAIAAGRLFGLSHMGQWLSLIHISEPTRPY